LLLQGALGYDLLGRHRLLLVRTHAAVVIDAQRPLLDALDSWAAIAGWFDGLVRLQEGRGCVGDRPLGSLASELADQDEAARADPVASFDRWEGSLARGLDRMRTRGELWAGADSADPAALAAVTMASLQGGLLLAQTRRNARPAARARRRVGLSSHVRRGHAP